MPPFSVLCIATFFKGEEFMRALKSLGHTVYLLTEQGLTDRPWPHEAIDHVFYLPHNGNDPVNLDAMVRGLAYEMRAHRIDSVVALDDYDVEKAALVRETFRLGGMGQTTARYFRDKLAMRIQARQSGIRIPAFSALFNDDLLTAFLNTSTGPWMVKPRSEASATGIRKVYSVADARAFVHSLGDARADYLIEEFRPGRVYHVDALTTRGKTVFTSVSQYLATPMEVAHGGGVFRTRTLPAADPLAMVLQKLNAQLLAAFGLRNSASHTEYILGDDDGEFYFLETACRVGGAHIAEMVEAGSGLNLWREWARLESALLREVPYKLPKASPSHAGLIVSLARQQWPDTSGFIDDEIWWRMQREQHIGLIVRSPDPGRVLILLDDYLARIRAEFHASAPARDKPLD
jgi:biotin carboxylase